MGRVEYLWERDYKRANESHGWYAVTRISHLIGHPFKQPNFKQFELAFRFSKFHFARGLNGEKKPI